MIKKFCSSCMRAAWHNEMKEKGAYRCTHCGDPVSKNPARREMQEIIRKKQSALPVK